MTAYQPSEKAPTAMWYDTQFLALCFLVPDLTPIYLFYTGPVVALIPRH